MKRFFLFKCLLIGLTAASHAQDLRYVPDVVLGNRSFTYLHAVSQSLGGRVRQNNLTLFDTDFREARNNIFFMRHGLSYSIGQRLAVHGAVGLKNPGAFISLYGTFRHAGKTGALTYALGGTYQQGWSLEQSLQLEYYPPLTPQLEAYLSLLAIGNVCEAGYLRGLQLMRAGIRTHRHTYGLALNADQFDNARKKLFNAGIFFKKQF